MAAIVVLRKNATVHVLDVIVPIMAGCYLLITLFVIIKNIGALPSVFQRIFEEAFGLRQVAAGGFGAVLMNGINAVCFRMRLEADLLHVLPLPLMSAIRQRQV